MRFLYLSVWFVKLYIKLTAEFNEPHCFHYLNRILVLLDVWDTISGAGWLFESKLLWPKKKPREWFYEKYWNTFLGGDKKKTQQQGCCGLHDTLNKDLIIVKSSNGAKLNLFVFYFKWLFGL